MAKVWKREWTSPTTGKISSAWICDYFDNGRKRRFKAFAKRKDADAYLVKVQSEVATGIHTAPSQSITVAQAAQNWIDHVKAHKRERSTIRQYQQHVDLHIVPYVGNHKLATLNTPRVEKLSGEWLQDLSRPMARKVLTSFKSLIKYAQLSGAVAQNVALPVKIKFDKRRDKQGRLTVGVDIPLPDEIRRIIGAAGEGMARALIMTAAFAGLRASELRGLRWSDVNFKDQKITVAQRADRFNEIGDPKSESGQRSVPIGPMLVNTLKAWKLQCPPSNFDLVFPTSTGKIQHHKNMADTIFGPAQVSGGVVGEDGAPKYSPHAFRHFYASWCINTHKDGGLELAPKIVQTRLGHASIVLTFDRYGHLFPSRDDGAELDAGMRAIFVT